MDIGQFSQILEEIITELGSQLGPLIDTTAVLPQIKEVTTLRRKLIESYRALNDARQMIPGVIESLELHALEEGSVPNNVSAGVAERIQEQKEREKELAAGVAERIQEQKEREKELAAAAAYVAELRARGNSVIPMPANRRSPQLPAEGGKRKKQKQKQATKRRYR